MIGWWSRPTIFIVMVDRRRPLETPRPLLSRCSWLVLFLRFSHVSHISYISLWLRTNASLCSLSIIYHELIIHHLPRTGSSCPNHRLRGTAFQPYPRHPTLPKNWFRSSSTTPRKSQSLVTNDRITYLTTSWPLFYGLVSEHDKAIGVEWLCLINGWLWLMTGGPGTEQDMELFGW